ncbi:hypothetical protein TrVFT333_004556 [Trichoderma virens FT-333]|nr:hypothetical protein TrVFT333_004556 [Trichoderma virens FT-333]
MKKTILSVLSSLGLLIEGTNAAAPYCTAGSSCFPNADELASFNSSVGGQLFKSSPYGSVCYEGSFEAAACSNLVANKGIAGFRETLPLAMILLLKPAHLVASSYYVNATTSEDISSSVKFAAKYNLRLRAKNTGHDYTGRSTDHGAFTIRTSNFRGLELIDDFIPNGCPKSVHRTSVLAGGAGVVARDIYNVSAGLGIITTGGYSSSVGVNGGFVQGGGAAGPWQPLFGMGADNVLQYDVVLTDGTITVANDCVNSDLFWAMRGGGGVFAIATKVYLEAHAAFQAVNIVAGEIIAADEASYQEMITQFVAQDPDYMKSFSSGLWETTFPALAMTFQKGFQYGEQVVSANTSLAAFEFLNSIPNVTVSLTAKQFPTFFEAYATLMQPLIDAGNRIGINIGLISRIIDKDLLGAESGRKNISDFILSLPSTQPFILQRVGGGSVNTKSTNFTSVNPAWRTSLGYMDIPIFDGSADNGPLTAFQNLTIDSRTLQANKVFGTNAYYNEDNKREPDF